MNPRPMGRTALSVPGKTFLIGEYLALKGGPSIVLATAPRFELRAGALADDEARFNFASQSPAGRLLSRHHESVRGYQIEFHDPHGGRGGLGASSAQFALLYAWLYGVDSVRDHAQLLKTYRECAWSGEGLPPSGADLIAQVTGGVTCFDGNRIDVRNLGWPFKNLGFSLLRTGSKLATHEHLKRVSADVPYEAIREQVTAATQAFEISDEEKLIGAVQNVALVLKNANLCAPHTMQILDELAAKCDWSLAAKGCGAMGADVILILHERAKASLVENWAKSRDLEICGATLDLAPGMQVEG